MAELRLVNRTISRKVFIKNTMLLITGIILSKNSIAKNKPTKIIILHTNDIHSRIESFSDSDPKNAGQGGLLKIAKIVKEIRENESIVLLLDCGDIFQGTPYFNEFFGEVEYKLMSNMGYDASTIGNHDLDNGIEGLVNQFQFKNFPIINSNYNLEKTALKDKIEKYKIIEKICPKTNKKIKIGIFGLGIELQGLVNQDNCKGIEYYEPIEIANEMSHKLKKKLNCDLVICLSHLGLEYENDKISDKILAKSTQNIDVILGGHTHTFMEKPMIIKNKINKDVIINQVGWAALILGKIDLEIF